MNWGEKNSTVSEIHVWKKKASILQADLDPWYKHGIKNPQNMGPKKIL